MRFLPLLLLPALVAATTRSDDTPAPPAPASPVVDETAFTLVADWSEGEEDVGKLLEALGSKQLPVIAVFLEFQLKAICIRTEPQDPVVGAGHTDRHKHFCCGITIHRNFFDIR